MKRTALIKQLRKCDYYFKREGGNHTIWENRKTKDIVEIPRHREINENTARKILKKARLGG